MSRILVVDDNPALCKAIARKLQSVGHEVLTAHDGEAGLEAARREQPDLVVLDWMMPRKAGVQVCAELRADEHLSNVPVMMVTARCSETDTTTGICSGADDYIVKPFNPSELARRIESLLAIGRLERLFGII